MQPYFLSVILIVSGICSYSAIGSAPASGSNQPVQVTATPQFKQLSSPPSSNLTKAPERLKDRAFENGRPLAARMNGQPLYLDVYEEEVSQFKQALESQALDNLELYTSSAHLQEQILDNLLDQILIEQQAALLGINITAQEVEAKAQEIVPQLENQAHFETWLANNHFTYEMFITHLRAQLIANRLFEQVSQDVPATAEQIWLRYMRVTDSATLQMIIEQLKTGQDFAGLAQIYSLDEESRIKGGDLGWLPKKSGLVPVEVEAVAFSLQPGEIGGPIQTGQGFYIVKLEGKDTARLLTPEMVQHLKKQIFTQWFQEKRASATIEKYIVLY